MYAWGCHLRQGVDYETDGCCHDLLGNIGFMYAVRQILRIKEGGLGYWALPCNSFSFMAKSLHQRTHGEPFGCNHHSFVVAGNILATRMVALLMLCVCRQVKFVVEQPDRSMAALFPYLQHLLSFPQVDPQRDVLVKQAPNGPWELVPCRDYFRLGTCEDCSYLHGVTIWSLGRC